MTALFSRGPAWLFCPADRPERFPKALARADVVILDLEDGVTPEAKNAARAAVRGSALDPERTIVRINPRSSEEHEADCDALRRTPYRYVMVPKVEGPDDLADLAGYVVIALCETPLGVTRAAELAAHPAVVALGWGAEDLVAAIGGTSSRRPDGQYRDVARHARTQVLLAAAAAGRPCVETVYLDLEDPAGLRARAADARGSGFAAMLCIHPDQVPGVREAFAPPPEQVEWARSVMAAAASAGRGAFRFEGRMVDEPLLRQARRILALRGDR